MVRVVVEVVPAAMLVLRVSTPAVHMHTNQAGKQPGAHTGTGHGGGGVWNGGYGVARLAVLHWQQQQRSEHCK
jgi:hypothetical protein